MPRFYFDSTVNGAKSGDDEGIELESLELARHEALCSATDMARDLAYRGQLADIVVTVRVGGGEPLATVRLSLRIEPERQLRLV
jgi:hypothetical protein